jgi:ankyrin repeat protein
MIYDDTVRVKNETLLHAAVPNGNCDLVSYLLEHGLDINEAKVYT